MTNRIVIGDMGSSTWGIRVSKAGVNVLTAGAGDLTLDSEATHLRSVQVGTFTIPAGSLTGSASVSGLVSGDTFGARIGLLAGSAIEQTNLAETFSALEVDESGVSATRRATSGSDTVMAYHVVAY